MRPSDSPEQDAADAAGAERAEFAQFALENLFDISPDAVVVTDASGKIRAANPRAAELFGYTPDELTGKSIDDLVPERFRRHHPSHRENYHAHPRARQMGAALNLYALRKDGSEFPVDIMLKPLRTPNGTAVLSIIRDVTEQREAQDLVRRKDLQLRSLLDGVRDYAIYLLDKDGYVTTWNPGAERIKQYTPDEIIGKHYSRFFTQEDLERDRPAELMKLAAQRGRVEHEGWRVRKDGTRFWANIVLTAVLDPASGEVTGYAKVTRDFTDRKRAEEAVMLQLSQALLANMDVRKLLGAIAASLSEVVPLDAATLGLYDENSGNLMVQFLAVDVQNPQQAEVRVPLDDSPAGRAYQTREPVLLDEIQGSDLASGAVHLTSLGMRSGCWVPLIHREVVVGVLAVASRRPSAFSQRELEMLVQVADQVAMAVSNAVVFRQIAELRDRLRQEKLYLEEEINLENRFEDIVGESGGLRQVLKQIETVAPTDATVLIQGETGTGKELLARALHRLSGRSDRTFVKVNCAAIPAGLLESELFGHEKGAFTGAIARKMGRVELAHEGTLFLDEVGELPFDLQPKLLRALQEREIERLGGNRPIPVNVRLIAATNRDLGEMVAAKQFRSDLYYRLKVFPIFSPPLRDRVGDIPVLVRHFVSSHSRRMGKNITSIPEQTMQALCRWPWPGNIRELENFLERSVILTRGSDLYVPLVELETKIAEEEEELERTHPTLQAAEREHVLRVLRETKGQIGGADGAAARLGLKRTTLNSKLKKLGIERPDYM
ncbi:MAG: sigma 54-interacting transcriptional regulator [Acidobacteria bacterium]|nr:sigma 54-interacting transcriptional regulator [Acidobacteriota bacterium]